MTMNSFRSLSLKVNAAQIRTAMYGEREHVVLPLVALVEGVMQAINSPEPEFVPREAFAVAPKGWDGRPVLGLHPSDPSDPAIKVSANSPNILEAEQFGTIFNSYVNGDKLGMEAWIDPAKARPGSLGAKVLERVRALQAGNDAQPIEISTGAFVVTEKRSGEFNGKRYSAVWREITPDHLAVFPGRDAEGACSVEMGCGAPRVAQNAEGGTTMADDKQPTKKSKWETVRDALRTAVTGVKAAEDAGTSDVDLRNALDRALRASEPGYLGIERVFPETTQVVYACAPADTVQYFRRSYVMDGNDATLTGDAEEVQLVSQYEPVKAASAADDKMTKQPKTAGCGCANAKEKAMADQTKAQRIQALVDSKKFTDADKKWLEAIPDEHLTAFEAAGTSPSQPTNPGTSQPAPQQPSAPQTPSAPAPQPPTTSAAKAKTVDEYLSDMPAPIADQFREGLRVQEARKAGLVKTLAAVKDSPYSVDELKGMTIPQLEKLAAFAKVETQTDVDYSVRNPAQPRDAESKVPAPINIADRVRQQKKQSA